MTRALNEVVVVDAVRTAFGRAGEKGLFWKTRAEELLGGPSAQEKTKRAVAAGKMKNMIIPISGLFRLEV